VELAIRVSTDPPNRGESVVESIPIFQDLRRNRNCLLLVARYHRPTLRCLCRDPGRPKCSPNRNVKKVIPKT
jgi:hypothetical protein